MSTVAEKRPGGVSTSARETQVIALVVFDVSNPFFSALVRGAEDAAQGSRCFVVLCNSDEAEDKEAHYLNLIADRGVAGLVVTPARESLRYLELIRKRGLGVVLVDNPGPGEGMCSVSVDNVKGGEFVGRHLASLGHQRIALVTGHQQISQLVQRRTGLETAVAETGRAPRDSIVPIMVNSLDIRGGQEAADRLLRMRSTLPTAVFCINDLLALGLLQRFSEEGVRVPEDIAVVGYDDLDFASALEVPLTTIRQPSYAMGKTAMSLILDELGRPEQHVHQQKVYVPELVVRGSTAG